MERSELAVRRAVHASSRTHPVVAALLCLTLSVGCHSFTLPERYSLPGDCVPCSICRQPLPDEGLAPARHALAAGKAAEEEGRAECVGLYCQAALHAWQQLECENQDALPFYRESLFRLVISANRHKRLDARGRLDIAGPAGRGVVPISYYGFAWKPADFCQVLPASDFRGSDLLHHYYTPGVGLSLVAVRQSSCEETYFRERQSFPVTAVLRPSPAGPILEFHNPLVFDSIAVGPNRMPLDRDLTASLVYMKELSPRRYIEGFLDPGEIDVKPKLVFMEPYQSGKVPVVFIHGLGADPLTWADAVNRLRAQRDIYQRYQFWFFHYPTGGDLLQSAAALREKLLVARETFDPRHADQALEQMVLVGHSLGGIIAQLQASYSYDILWRQAAHRPLDEVRAAPDVREELRRSFYFDPSPLVKRVVFIATPHHGSGMARRLVGRAASRLVSYSPEEEAVYRRLMDDNRDIFAEYLWKRKPTAVDLLEPDNPLLAAMARMPFGPCVRLHSIVGDRFPTLDGQLSDGVVPVSSSHLEKACSQRFVSARHEQTNKVDEALDELTRILASTCPKRP